MARRQPISIGDTFERLTVIGEAEWYVTPTSGKRIRQWLVRCECGKEKPVLDASLKCGDTKSCGCRQRSGLDQTTHGRRHSLEYSSWTRMVQRCTNRNSDRYVYYGARGITICARWLGPDGFVNFYADMGPRPPGLTLERKDNMRGYEPGNCVWATDEDQQNNKQNNHWITAFGKTMTLAQWSRETGIGADTISARRHQGWSAERAVGEAVRATGRGLCPMFLL